MRNVLRVAPVPALLLGLAALPLLGGCGGSKFYPVRGQVLLFGVGPLKEGEVRFQPVSRPDLIATGQIKKGGAFELSTPGHGEGVLEGDCRAAVVVPPRDGKPVIAERFADFATSDLKFRVTARDENNFYLEVYRPGK